MGNTPNGVEDFFKQAFKHEGSNDAALERLIEDYRVELGILAIAGVVWGALVLLLHFTPITAGVVVGALAIGLSRFSLVRETVKKIDLHRRWDRAVRHCNLNHPSWSAHKPAKIRLSALTRIQNKSFAYKAEERKDYSLEEVRKNDATELDKQKNGRPLGEKVKVKYVGDGYEGKIRLSKGLEYRNVALLDRALGAEMRMFVHFEEDFKRPHEATVLFLTDVRQDDPPETEKPDHLAQVRRDEDLFTP